MITGAHLIVYSQDAEADRSFFRDVFGFDSVDAGHGWLIFALPPAEVAFHPGDESRHELYLMCDDLETTMAGLQGKGVVFKDRWRSSPGDASPIWSFRAAGRWESTSRSTRCQHRSRLQKTDRPAITR